MSNNNGERVKDEPRSKRIWLILALVAAAVLIVLVVVGMRRVAARRAEEERKATERARASVPTVRVARVGRLRRLLDRVELSGTLRASRDVTVMPEVPGKLERVGAARGQKVRAGDMLAVVESDTLKAGLDQASAALSVAISGARAARVARDNAASDRKRLRALERSGSASDREVEGAETMLKTAEAQLAVAESRVEQAGAAVRLAKLHLDKAVLTAPFAGTVADDFNRTAGTMVGPQVPIARVVEMQNLRIDLRASERDLARIRNGQKAEVRIASSPGRVFEGLVLVAGPVVDPMTRTAPIEIAVENAVEDGEYLLKPGMFTDVKIVVDERENVLAVGPECLTSHEGADAVFTIRPANEVVVRFRPEALARLGITMDDVLGEFGKGEIEITAAQAAEARTARPPRIPVDSDMFDELMNKTVDSRSGARRRDVAELELVLRPEELRRRKLAVSGVVEALRRARVEVPEGKVAEASLEHVRHLPGERDLADRIAGLLLDADRGIRVRDVAAVELVPVADRYRIVARPVEVGLRAGARVEISGGLAEGDLVVVTGVRALTPGAEVRVETEFGTEKEPQR